MFTSRFFHDEPACPFPLSLNSWKGQCSGFTGLAGLCVSGKGRSAGIAVSPTVAGRRWPEKKAEPPLAGGSALLCWSGSSNLEELDLDCRQAPDQSNTCNLA
jgi:hypothetical protein